MFISLFPTQYKPYKPYANDAGSRCYDRCVLIFTSKNNKGCHLSRVCNFWLTAVYFYLMRRYLCCACQFLRLYNLNTEIGLGLLCITCCMTKYKREYSSSVFHPLWFNKAGVFVTLNVQSKVKKVSRNILSN